MEEIKDLHNNNNIGIMPPKYDGEEEESRSTTFSELKHLCLELLDLLQNPKKNTSTLAQLHHFLRHSSPDSLQPFFDYTLFPLLLLLDAAVNCRSQSKVDLEDRPVMSNAPKTPHKVSDTVAEGTLQCLEELLSKCHLGSVDQVPKFEIPLIMLHMKSAFVVAPPAFIVQMDGEFICVFSY